MPISYPHETAGLTSGVGTSVPVRWLSSGTPDVAVDDVCIAVIATRAVTSQSITPPAGWTQIGSGVGLGGGGCLTAVFWRRVTAADLVSPAPATPPVFTFTLAVSSPFTWQTTIYRNVDLATPIEASGVNTSGASGTTLTAPSVTTTVPDCQMVELWGVTRAVDADASPNYAALPPTDRGGYTGNNMTGISDQALTVAGSTGTVTLNLTSAAAPWVAHTVVLKAGPAGWGVGQIRMGPN